LWILLNAMKIWIIQVGLCSGPNSSSIRTPNGREASDPARTPPR
jgi:hypothetical protein